MLDLDLKNTKRFFLARHGESVANREKRISGQMDFPLTEKGESQAHWLCDVLKSENITAIYASSLSRAMATAQPTAAYHNLKIQAIDKLKEIDFGTLQGRVADGSDAEANAFMKARHADKNISVPGGESFPDFQQRIWDCFAAIMRTMPDKSLIVAHRNTNEVILTRLLALDQTDDKAINIKNKYVYEIVLADRPTINTVRLGGEQHGKKFPGFKDD